MIISCCVIAQTTVALYLFNSLKPKSQFDKRLNIFLLVLFLHLGTRFFILFVLKDYALYNNNITGFGLAYGPLLFFMTRLLLQLPISKKNLLLHFAPFAWFTLLYFLRAVAYVFNLKEDLFLPVYNSWYQWLTLASLMIYSFVSLKNLRSTKTKPGVNQNQVQLILQIAACILLGAIVGLIAFLYHYITTHNSIYDLRLIPYLTLFIIPVLILRYKMLSSTVLVLAAEVISNDNQYDASLAHTEEQPVAEEKHYKKSSLDDETMDRYESALISFIEKTKIYLDSELSLETLSLKIAIPKHHLTQLLNERFKKNFYAFVNEYRIKEAINKLSKANEDENILSLAFDCGFNSKSSFNNYFKKITGTTPSEFRKAQKSSVMQPA